jgi:hypothetical protein
MLGPHAGCTLAALGCTCLHLLALARLHLAALASPALALAPAHDARSPPAHLSLTAPTAGPTICHITIRRVPFAVRHSPFALRHSPSGARFSCHETRSARRRCKGTAVVACSPSLDYRRAPADSTLSLSLISLTPTPPVALISHHPGH